MATARALITGSGAICGAGRTPAEIFSALASGHCAIGPIAQWDVTQWPAPLAAEVRDYDAAKLTGDRKVLKFVRRTDVFGLYAADRAIENAGLTSYRATLDDASVRVFNDGCGVYVGSGGGAFQNQYDYFPLMTVADGSLEAFGRELDGTVNPMWLLQSLPNNVLGHVGIRHELKGPNACITHHSASGPLAIVEATEALRGGECARAVAIAHDASIEPQMILYYRSVGLLSERGLRPFDVAHDGSLMGEGAAALVLETEDAARERGAGVLGEVLGSGHRGDALGLLPIRDDGAGLVRAILDALAGAQLRPADVGMVVAHGNGTPNSDASEARALATVFGDEVPPVTAFKWSIGHLLAASGMIESVLALEALRAGTVPAIANLRRVAPECVALPVAGTPQSPRSDVALVLARGFGGTNTALLLRAATA
jgi:3-oxoacyl-[acyl-carrier-protein] synthase-1